MKPPTTVLRQKDHELDVYTIAIAKGPGDHTYTIGKTKL